MSVDERGPAEALPATAAKSREILPIGEFLSGVRQQLANQPRCMEVGFVAPRGPPESGPCGLVVV